jgi:small GTP-binding protein
MSQNKDDEEIKIVLIGDSGVGKTNLINTSVGLDFNIQENSTVNSSFVIKEYYINDKKYIANLWDTAGQEAYKGITQLFFRGAEIILLVYDICVPESFESLNEWYELSESTINNEHIYGVIGNKNDLYLDSKVDEGKAKEFAEAKNALFKLASAKENPSDFIDFVEELIIKYKNIKKTQRRQSIKITKNNNIKSNQEKKKCCN